MGTNLLLSATSALIAGLLLLHQPFPPVVIAFGLLSLWQLYSATVHRRPGSRIVLRLGGFAWTTEDFCRGWLITGETGSGKTLGGINTMLWQVCRNCPTWGGVCVDDKGLYAETLARMLDRVGRRDDLIVLSVRPDGATPDWQPPHTLNPLDDPHLPFSGKAKLICDVACALGQRSDQTFFRTQAQVQMEFAFRVLAAAELPVTLHAAYDLLTSDAKLKGLIAELVEHGSPHAEALVEHYESHFDAQPPEQLGGVKATIANYLKYFTDPDISAVFCPCKSSVHLKDIDRGKIFCVSVPQRFPVERRYIHTLLKLGFYSHALRRFDRSAAERAADNLLIFWAGEAQKVVTASEDGLSDYNVVDVIREARATFVGDTQAYTSLIPPMGDEKKAKVFIANMANRITFKCADEDSARIAADTIGKRTIRKRTHGWSAGRRTTSWTADEKYFIEPHQFRRLRIPRGRAALRARFPLRDAAPARPRRRNRLMVSTLVEKVPVVHPRAQLLAGLARHLQSHIRGQPEALELICSVLTRGELGFAHPRRPRGSFLFIGPTGVGKTETANVFTSYLFDGAPPVRFDMSEYQLQKSVDKLIGESAGDHGLLGKALLGLTHGTLLFDELEKAHPLVLDLFLQVLEDGRITLATGETLDLTGFYIVFTSNIGSREVMGMASPPFSSVKRTVLTRAAQQLRPELFGRITEKVVFARLDYATQRAVCEQMIAAEIERLTALGYPITVDAEAVEFLLREGYHKTLGARPLRGTIERRVQDAIAAAILSGQPPAGSLFVHPARDRLVLHAPAHHGNP